MESEKPYKTQKIKSSKGDKEYTVCFYETFETCSCKGYEVRNTCKHIKLCK